MLFTLFCCEEIFVANLRTFQCKILCKNMTNVRYGGELKTIFSNEALDNATSCGHHRNPNSIILGKFSAKEVLKFGLEIAYKEQNWLVSNGGFHIVFKANLYCRLYYRARPRRSLNKKVELPKEKVEPFHLPATRGKNTEEQ